MATSFERVITVLVDDLKVEGLRCEVKADRSLKKEPNTLDLKIYNLSASTRGAMKRTGAKVVVLAGYARGSTGIIFSGEARTTDHVRASPDIVTHVQCADGEEALRFAVITAAFKPGVSAREVVSGITAAMGVNKGNAVEEVERVVGAAFAAGVSFHGKAKDELDALLKKLGLTWSVQDGALLVLPAGGALPGDAVLISPDTGLVGSPDHATPDKKGGPSLLRFRALMAPNLRCGSLVQLQSREIHGTYVVQRVVHSGDTHGGEWYSDVEALPQ
jgi:hypothetical protein